MRDLEPTVVAALVALACVCAWAGALLARAWWVLR